MTGRRPNLRRARSHAGPFRTIPFFLRFPIFISLRKALQDSWCSSARTPPFWYYTCHISLSKAGGNTFCIMLLEDEFSRLHKVHIDPPRDSVVFLETLLEVFGHHSHRLRE